MISTPHGDVAIEKLRAGDRVWSWTNNGQIENIISETFVRQTTSYYKLTTMSRSLSVTGTHPLLTPSGYKTVSNIQLGDGLVTMSGSKIVLSKTYIQKAVTVYNFEVGEPHNYFANGFVVHNKPM
jgi:intein/homing endonuclease